MLGRFAPDGASVPEGRRRRNETASVIADGDFVVHEEHSGRATVNARVSSEIDPATNDDSNGYEAVVGIYIAGRGTRSGHAIGAAVVKAWADAFPPGAIVLDLGSGPGEPSTRILRDAGLVTYALDASPTMVAAFRERFPCLPIEQNTVEGSAFFNRTFDGVLAWGLLFLLNPTAQALVIEKVARA